MLRSILWFARLGFGLFLIACIMAPASAQPTLLLEEAKLIVANTPADQRVGSSVALTHDGNTAFVGASAHAGFNNTSWVLIYRRLEAGDWGLHQQIIRTGTDQTDRGLGISIAATFDGRRLIAGAPCCDIQRGAVYVYDYNESTDRWTQSARIESPWSGTAFGASLGLSHDGRMILVGARGEDGQAGAAYVYRQSESGSWVQEARLIHPDFQRGFNELGWSVSLSADGTLALVGVPGELLGSTRAGSALLYRRSEQGQWHFLFKLRPSNLMHNDNFGQALALSSDGELALVGSPFSDLRGDASGSAYLFRRVSDDQWTQEHKLTAGDAAPQAVYGTALSLSADGHAALVGARGFSASAAYLYLYEANDWIESVKLKGSDAGTNDYFGIEIAISGSGNRALVGAYRQASLRGAAYAFDLTPYTVANEPPPAQTLSRLAVYPNPAFGRATVALNLPQPERVRVVVYDVLGREVRRLAEGTFASRSVAVEGLPPGLYLVVAEGDGWRQSARLVVAR
jgi:hypothetical protein